MSPLNREELQGIRDAALDHVDPEGDLIVNNAWIRLASEADYLDAALARDELEEESELLDGLSLVPGGSGITESPPVPSEDENAEPASAQSSTEASTPAPPMPVPDLEPDEDEIQV